MLKSAAFAPCMAVDPIRRGDLLGTVLSNLDGMVYRCRVDECWTMEFVSQGCADLTGYAPEELLLNSRISYEDITHPDDRRQVRCAVYEAITCGRRFSLEYRIVRRNGEVRWVLERGTVITDGASAVVALEGFIQDISERKQSEEALREAERRYRSIFENALEGIYQSTPSCGYLAVNPALARIYGYESQEQLIWELRDIGNQLYVEPERRTEFMRRMERDGIVTGFESRVYQRDGTIIWISENARAVRDAEGRLLFYEGTVEAITERKLHEAEIQFRATHDALTGLPNRTMLYDRMEQAVRQAHRSGGLVAVVFVDLDQFKYVNDSLGHQAGDQLLKTVAGRLKSCVRNSDTVARQGGDEFVIILTSQTSRESISQALQRILAAVTRPWFANGMEVQVTCSMGVSLCPTDSHDPDTLLKNADAAMFRAKEMGRNNFQFFDAEMNAAATNRLEMTAQLRHALTDEKLVLHYQPKVSLRSGELVGAEALVRWNVDEGRMVPPGEFIPLAEETGLIIPIGEWVLRTACAEGQAWQAAGYVPVSVNLSPLQLERGNIVAQVSEALALTGLAPHCLELEITENLLMRDLEKSLRVLAELKELGVRISIDDFGTGYSSLAYLKRFPVDTLKIDRSFIRNIAVDRDNASIVKAIVSLGHALELKVLAEGVETVEECDFLRHIGCDEMQGYFYGRPLAQMDFIQML